MLCTNTVYHCTLIIYYTTIISCKIMKRLIMDKVIKAFSVTLLVILARLLPFNSIIGSTHAMFSWSTIFAPVIAAQCGISWVLGFFLCKKLWLAPSLIVLLHRAPLLIAARAFQARDFFTSICLPLICMLLFVTHAVGSQAWPYALYWFIPFFLYFVKDSVWVRSLQASFIAHAVGSVVWLYFGTISPEVWMSLIPVVICERLLIAGGMVACNTLCSIIVQSYYALIHSTRVFCGRINQ